MSLEPAATPPCTCGSRDNLRRDLNDSRDAIWRLDGENERLAWAVDNLLLRAAPIAACFRDTKTVVTPEEYDGFLEALAALNTARHPKAQDQRDSDA